VTDRLRFTILGCGSSAGTPRINGDWGRCDPANPRNRRSRAAALVERLTPDGRATRVVIDTGPDFREQMIRSGVADIDAAVFTHAHADHIHGIDDLRSYVLVNGRLMDIYADDLTFRRLSEAFGYCFESPPGSSYPPILRRHGIDHAMTVVVEGEGGPLAFEPLPQQHGDIVSLGFRIGPVAYCPDVNDFPVATVERMDGLELLVIDALQYKGHPSHLSLAEALDWIERLKPKRALLTHMHTPLDYETVLLETPPHVEPAYDGQVLEFDIKADETSGQAANIPT